MTVGKKNHDYGKIIFGFPLAGLILAIVWTVYESSTLEISGGSDPGVIQKSIGLTLIPLAVGIVAGLIHWLISRKAKRAT